MVNAKGDLRIPLIKSVHVAGLTQTEAEDALATSLATLIKCVENLEINEPEILSMAAETSATYKV